MTEEDDLGAVLLRTTAPRDPKHWKAGESCRIDGAHIGRQRGRMYEAVIQDVAFSSAGKYQSVTLQITATVQVFGQSVSQSWTHPISVPSYKLRAPLLKDGKA